MNLYVLRHGLAVEPGAPGALKDADRPLTPKGKRKIRKIAQAMETLELSFELILSSPYVRARQTAEIVARVLNFRQLIPLTDTLTPGSHPRQCLELLTKIADGWEVPLGSAPGVGPTRPARPRKSAAPEDILLVGHEPHLSALISLVFTGGAGAAIDFKKGGLCKLAVASLKPRFRGELQWLLTPALLLQLRDQ